MHTATLVLTLGLAATVNGAPSSAAPSKPPDTSPAAIAPGDDIRTATDCKLVKVLQPVLERGRAPARVELQRCACTAPDVGAPERCDRLVLRRSAGDVVLHQAFALIDPVEVVDLLHDGRQELLIVDRADGTAGDLGFSVVGSVAGALRAWAVPDLRRALERLPDEADSGNRGPFPIIVRDRLLVCRQIRVEGDPPCCGTGGYVVVELEAQPGSFHVGRVYRREDEPRAR